MPRRLKFGELAYTVQIRVPQSTINIMEEIARDMFKGDRSKAVKYVFDKYYHKSSDRPQGPKTLTWEWVKEMEGDKTRLMKRIYIYYSALRDHRVLEKSGNSPWRPMTPEEIIEAEKELSLQRWKEYGTTGMLAVTDHYARTGFRQTSIDEL